MFLDTSFPIIRKQASTLQDEALMTEAGQRFENVLRMDEWVDAVKQKKRLKDCWQFSSRKVPRTCSFNISTSLKKAFYEGKDGWLVTETLKTGSITHPTEFKKETAGHMKPPVNWVLSKIKYKKNQTQYSYYP